MEPCCILAVNPFREGRVLYETDNFFISATLGAMGIEGYLLIVSHEHYEGTGDMPEELHKELDSLVLATKRVLRSEYGLSSIVFEHGPRVGMCGWGGCIDHAHLHIVPGVDISSRFAVDVMGRLDENGWFYRVDRVEGFRRTMDIFDQRKTSYVLLETPDAKRLVSEVNFPGPRQWLRRLTARQIGTEKWNWRLYPDKETATRTVRKLEGKF